jgi:hypothetical protein
MGTPRQADVDQAKQKPATHHKNGDQPGVKLDDRGCTDVIVCLIFVAMIVVMAAITGYAFGNGDLQRIATKYDMDGAKCGGDYPYKLFTRLMPARTYYNSVGAPVPLKADAATMAYSVCVDKCPDSGDKDLKFQPNAQYPADSYELKTWDSDTDVVMDFCFPALESIQEMAAPLYS